MEGAEDRERRATNLELFLDLVFVFAVTQIASMVAADLGWAGVGRGGLIAFLVWWQWSQYTWAGAAVDLQREPWTRLLVLATIPATLTMAVAIPEAFGQNSRWFGCAYLVVQLLVLVMQGSYALRAAPTRPPFLRYASTAAFMPIAVAVGSFAHGNARVAWWCAAAALNVVSAFRAATAGEWTINPGHFSERHALFIIISLGETLVAVGAAAHEIGLSATTLVGMGCGVLLASVVWWMYFAYVPDVCQHHLARMPPSRRGVAARDLFTFGHFPLVAGIIGLAIVIEHMVGHPGDPLDRPTRSLLAGAVVVLIGGFLHIQWRIVRHCSLERIVAIPVVTLLCLAARGLAGAALVASVAALLLVMHSITWRSFRRGEFANLTSNH